MKHDKLMAELGVIKNQANRLAKRLAKVRAKTPGNAQFVNVEGQMRRCSESLYYLGSLIVDAELKEPKG